jgi:hypothetical protein
VPQREDAERDALDHRKQEVSQRRQRRAVPGHLVAFFGQKLGAQGGLAQAGNALGERQLGQGLVRRVAHKRVERRLQAQDHADAARCHLHPQRQALCHRRLGAGEDAAPLPRLLIALRQRDRQRVAWRSLRHALQQIELSVEAVGALCHVEVGHRLQHAVREPGQRLGQAA